MEVVGQTESKPRAGPDGRTMGLSPKANGIEDVAPSWPMRGGAHECEEVTHPARGVQIEPQRADSSGGCNVLVTGGAMGIGRTTGTTGPIGGSLLRRVLQVVRELYR